MKTLNALLCKLMFVSMLLFTASVITAQTGNWTDAGNYRSAMWEGSGTSTDPYKISNGADFGRLSVMVNGLNGVTSTDYAGKYFKITAYIDLRDHYWTPVGNLVKPFKGSIDGKGFVIFNMKISISDTNDDVCAGLIGNLDGGTITDVHIGSGSTIDVSGGNDLSVLLAGSIAGSNTGILENCSNKAPITVKSRSLTRAGGIAGGGSGTIRMCYNTGTLNVEQTGQTDISTGGICGYNNGGTLTNCYNTADLLTKIDDEDYSSNYCGGISAYNANATVSNCYNAGAIKPFNTSNTTFGGIMGYNYGSTISNSYFLQEGTINAGMKDSYGGNTNNPKSSAELKLLTATLNNGGNNWINDYSPNTNNGYPVLAWQTGIREFILNFDYQGADNGNSETSRQVIFLNEIGNLPVPTRKNYVFAGWKVNDTAITGTSYYIWSSNVSAIAQWKPDVVSNLTDVANAKLVLSPNPATSYFTIRGINSIGTLQITDLGGRTVLTQKVVDGSSVNVSALTKGIYMVNVAGKSIKLIKN